MSISCDTFRKMKSCWENGCESSHISEEEIAAQVEWDAVEKPMTIICAGPQRSGSTWLWNTMRLILTSAKQRHVDYWIHDLSTNKINERKEEGSHLLLKTQEWSDEWKASEADLIFVTHRDIRGVVSSQRRMGWQPKSLSVNVSMTKLYVSEHEQWSEVSQLNLGLEDIMMDKQKATASVAEKLGFPDVDCTKISSEVDALKPPKSGQIRNPVTKLYPKHFAPNKLFKKKSKKWTTFSELTEAECDSLSEKFYDYQKQYGYISRRPTIDL